MPPMKTEMIYLGTGSIYRMKTVHFPNDIQILLGPSPQLLLPCLFFSLSLSHNPPPHAHTPTHPPTYVHTYSKHTQTNIYKLPLLIFKPEAEHLQGSRAASPQCHQKSHCRFYSQDAGYTHSHMQQKHLLFFFLSGWYINTLGHRLRSPPQQMYLKSTTDHSNFILTKGRQASPFQGHCAFHDAPVEHCDLPRYTQWKSSGNSVPVTDVWHVREDVWFNSNPQDTDVAKALRKWQEHTAGIYRIELKGSSATCSCLPSWSRFWGLFLYPALCWLGRNTKAHQVPVCDSWRFLREDAQRAPECRHGRKTVA